MNFREGKDIQRGWIRWRIRIRRRAYIDRNLNMITAVSDAVVSMKGIKTHQTESDALKIVENLNTEPAGR